MESDPLTSFQTPPRKGRKATAVQLSPPRLSDLMAAFGARRLLMSIGRMEMQSDRQRLRPLKQPFSYAESDSDVTPQTSPGSSFEDSFESSKTSIELHDDETDDELQDGADAAKEGQDNDELQSDDVIVGTLLVSSNSIYYSLTAQCSTVASRPHPSRELPKRSTRSSVNYATPKRFKQQKKKLVSKGRKPKPLKLTSDLFASSSSKQANAETERNQIHQEIAKNTEPKRHAFLLVHKAYFLPLLPERNYIDKLQGLSDDLEPIVPYKAITTQPKGVVATMKPYQLEGLSFLVSGETVSKD